MQTKEKLTSHNTRFENLGFFIEYLVNDKLIGCKNVNENDRGCVGYYSRQNHIAENDIIFKNKIIRSGTKYHTRIYPLCGKVIKKKCVINNQKSV